MSDLYLAALREHQLGNVDSAECHYKNILKDDPNNHDVLHLLGILLSQRQDFLNARCFIDRALAIDPDSHALHNSMGNVLKNLNQYDEAVSHYKTSLQLKPNSASAHNNLGNIYYHLEKNDDAKKHYQESIRLMPQQVDAYYNLSLVLTKQGFTSEASDNLKMVLHLQPEHEKAHGSLACLLQLDGDFDKAMHHYQKALEADKESITSHHNLGVILTNNGRYDEATDHFKKVLDLQPQHIEALNNLGSIFLLQKKAAEALPYFFLLSDLTDDFDVYYNLGVIYLELASFDEAMDSFVKALKILPNDFAANVNLGVIYLKRRDFVNAEKQYLKAHYLQPDNEEILYILKAIQQKNPQSKAPVQYVKNLFDKYAPSFDKHLEMLGHKVPQLLFEEVQAAIDNNDDNSLVVLDLGCGTGLSGVHFKDKAKRLIGIDLSEEMLGVARGKDIYTDLKVGAIEDLITDFSEVDVIIASDSFVYFGELGDVFSKCYQVLNNGGVFAFTVESSNKIYPYFLQRSARFAHSSRYINEIASKNNFAILQSKEIVLRKQGETIIAGNLFILKK